MSEENLSEEDKERIRQKFIQSLREGEAQRVKEELEEILKESYLDPYRLWLTNQENFVIWTRVKYYKPLIEHLDKNLPLFEVWRRTWRFGHEDLLNFGISNLINSKKNYTKDIYKYIIEASGKYENVGKKSRFVSYTNLDGKSEERGPYFSNTFSLIESFVPYFEWIKYQSRTPLPYTRHPGSLVTQYPTTINPDSLSTNIEILDGFNLLKMGGISAPLTDSTNLNVKHISLGNLDYLKLEGRITTQSRELVIEDSYVRHLLIENCDLALVRFENCVVTDIQVENSNLTQWKFNDCFVTGTAINSRLSNIQFNGGRTELSYHQCSLSNVNIRTTRNHISLHGIINLKLAYNSQGHESLSTTYFMLEKKAQRQLALKQILNSFSRIQKQVLKSGFSKNILLEIRQIVRKIRTLFTLVFNLHFWGYARQPKTVIRNSLLTIVGFAFYNSTQIKSPEMSLKETAIEGLWSSLSAFSTLGLFSSETTQAIGHSSLVIESIFGTLLLAAFIGSLSNFKH